MLESYLQIFYATCTQLVPLIVPVFMLYLVMNFAGMLFHR